MNHFPIIYDPFKGGLRMLRRPGASPIAVNLRVVL